MSEAGAFQVRYGPGRFPIQQRREDGTLGCRGCGAAIPPHRAWCGGACKKRWHPTLVIFAVRRRDKDVCAACGLDMAEEKRRWYAAYNVAIDGGTGSEWKASNPKPPKPNYDHIVPFSEGGLTVLENMRTLCEPCHKKRTKHWHGEKTAARRRSKQPELFP